MGKKAIAPHFVSRRFVLAGVERKIDFGSDFGPALDALYRQVTDRLDGIQGLTQPARIIGYWYSASGGDVYYFAGVEAQAAPEGLTVKALPESLYAVFDEQRRGAMGGPEGAGYKWLGASKEYTYNEAIPGDLEVYANMTDTDSNCFAEIYIPIKKK